MKTVASRSSSSGLSQNFAVAAEDIVKQASVNLAADSVIPTNDIPFAVDGHRASITLTSDGLQVDYALSTKCCFIPSQRSEFLPYNEILSAHVLVPVVTRWLWRPVPEATFRFALYTFKRSARSPTHWFPRCLIISTTREGIARSWTAAINAAVATKLQRPHHLLVFINPYGGRRRALSVYQRQVAPVFEKAGIKCTVERTQFQGHAKAFIMDLSAQELESYDGIVAVGGDGLFHEIVNGLIALRSRGALPATFSGTTTDNRPPSAASSHPPPYPETPYSGTQPTEYFDTQKARVAAALRVGHIPAGSTDAVACTLNGTRSAFSAAMRIALGDGVPLDVLRIDAANGRTEFATSMASYGFMGDLMAESEGLRWMGPARYEVMGAKMLAANRSYSARISYLPASNLLPGCFSRICSSNCQHCLRPSRVHVKSKTATELSSPFARHSRHSLFDRTDDWVTVEGEFAGIMLVIMPCRSDKSKNGVARYGHLSDGNIHLVLVKRCTRWQYLKFLMKMSSQGLEAGCHEGYIEVIPAVAVKVEPGDCAESTWNIDGELLQCASITAETHRGAIQVFSRGIETADLEGW